MSKKKKSKSIGGTALLITITLTLLPYLGALMGYQYVRLGGFGLLANLVLFFFLSALVIGLLGSHYKKIRKKSSKTEKLTVFILMAVAVGFYLSILYSFFAHLTQ